MHSTVDPVKVMTKCTKPEQDFVEIGSVEGEMSNANILGIVKALSPLKKSKRNTEYYDGQLVDGSGVIRLFGFSPEQHKKLQEHQKSEKPITLSGCSITTNKKTGNYELKLQTKTTLQTASDDIKIVEKPIQMTTIAAIKDECTHMINLEARILTILDTIAVSESHRKQDIIADKTGTMKLTLWDNDIDKLDLDQCYKLNNLEVKVYLDSKFLSPSRDGLSYTSIADIGVTENSLSDYNFGTILNGIVIGVNNIKFLMTCVKCTKKMVINDEDMYTTCRVCSTLQRVQHTNNAEFITELVIKDTDHDTNHILRANKAIVAKLLGETQNKPSEMIQHQLLDGRSITVTYVDMLITQLEVSDNQ